jgi:hypothetical protein
VLVLIGLFHTVMPHVLAWPHEFAALRTLTRQIMYTRTYFIGLTCVLLGLAPLALSEELLAPGRMSTAVLAAESVFWGCAGAPSSSRTGPALWRRSRLHRLVYAASTLLWTWIASVFVTALTR